MPARTENRGPVTNVSNLIAESERELERFDKLLAEATELNREIHNLIRGK